MIVQWAEMKEAGFVPENAKSVENEARNGLLLCKTHHGLFDSYLRWMPEVVFYSILTSL